MSSERMLRVKIDDQEIELNVDDRRPQSASEHDALYWGLLWFDKSSLYFSLPDLAKHHAIGQLDDQYRYDRKVMDIGSMSGFERFGIKAKAATDKQEIKDNETYWAKFKAWLL